MRSKRIAWLGLAAIFSVPILAYSFFPEKVIADSPWLNGNPNISKADKIISLDDYNELRKQKQGYTAGLRCYEKRIAIRTSGSLSKRYKEDCWYHTKIGLLGRSGDYLLQPGTEIAGYIFVHPHPGYQTKLLPTPNPNVFIEAVPAPAVGYGSYIHLRTLDELSFSREEHSSGAVTLRYESDPKFELKDINGTLTHTQSSLTWWSSDNKYMLVWSRSGPLHRINLETFKVLSAFVAPKPRGQFLDGSAALSMSGRFAAVAIEKPIYADLFLLDLDSCDQTELPYATMTGANCEKRSFQSVLLGNVPSFSIPLFPKFYGEYTLGIYHQQANSTDLDHYLLQANGTEPSSNRYVALGDSFSSGEGAGDYEPGTDVKDLNMCHTSHNSYPYLINNQLNLTDFLSVACSGARMVHILGKAQYNPVGSENLLPGSVMQIKAITNKHPDKVTLTISGNDIGFSDKLKYCLIWSSDCYSTYKQRKQIAEEIKALHPSLIGMYRKIAEKSLPGAKLYVLGYPQIISNEDSLKCGINTPLNTYQRNMANDLITYFNAVIRSAAAHAGAFYVGTEGALSGHRLCEGPSATLAVNGVTLGDDTGIWKLRFLSNGSFHPNQLGHKLLKDRVLSFTNNLSEPMPLPDKSSPIPDPEDYPFLDVPHEGGLTRTLYYNQQAEPSLWKVGADVLIKVAAPWIPLPPLTTFDVFLHSEPIKLGQVTSNNAGIIDSTIKIPTNTPPGMHELHIQGEDMYGNPIDVYEFVYVAYSEEDFDGDGTLNEDEPCGIVPVLSQDADSDGIDDICDPPADPVQVQTQNESAIVSPTSTLGIPRVDSGTQAQPPTSNSAPGSRALGQQTTSPSQPETLASTVPIQERIEERLNKLPLTPIFIFIGTSMAALTFVYYLRYARE